VRELLQQLGAQQLGAPEAHDRGVELGLSPLALDLVACDAREHHEQRLLVLAERARLAVMQAERPVERAIGEPHLRRAEGADVPVDAEALLEPQPLLPQRGLLAHVRHDRGREAQVHARAEALLEGDE
jgi:hypothetical protein